MLNMVLITLLDSGQDDWCLICCKLLMTPCNQCDCSEKSYSPVKGCLSPKFRHLNLRLKFRIRKSKLLICVVYDTIGRQQELHKIHLPISRKVKYSWELYLFLIFAIRKNEDDCLRMHDKHHTIGVMRGEYSPW